MKKINRKHHFLVNDNFYNSKSGVWCFIPDNAKKYKQKKPCTGFGIIRYDEGSIYTGDIYFDGQNYNKIGFGRQDFASSGLGNTSLENERILCYVGQYDYRKTDWIYGNGVLYFVDKQGNPTHFVKGFYDGVAKIGEYTESFGEKDLIDGYTLDMESDYCPRDDLFNNELKDYIPNSKLEALFIGDSYFEFWHYKEFANKVFKEVFSKDKYLNLGLGGTKFSDWLIYGPKIKLDNDPKKIIIHLGVNDTHSWISRREILRNYNAFIEILKSKFPTSKIYLLTATLSSAFEHKKENVIKWNKLIKKEAKKDDVAIIDLADALQKEYEEKGTNFFVGDGLHLNEDGYKMIIKLLKEINNDSI